MVSGHELLYMVYVFSCVSIVCARVCVYVCVLVSRARPSHSRVGMARETSVCSKSGCGLLFCATTPANNEYFDRLTSQPLWTPLTLAARTEARCQAAMPQQRCSITSQR